jgi:uncharacterized protein YkwD
MKTLCSAAPVDRMIRSLKLVAVIAAVVTSFAFAPGLHAQTSPAGDASRSVEMVNAARSQASVSTLDRNAGLDSIARAQAERMAQADAISHNPNLKSDADAAGVNWRLIGENVGVGPDVESVHNAFMASPGHYQNIVYASYNTIGVGVALGQDGSVFVAQAFANVVLKPPHPTVASAPVQTSHSAQPAAAAPVVHTAASHREPDVRPAAPTALMVNAIIGGVVDVELDLGV